MRAASVLPRPLRSVWQRLPIAARIALVFFLVISLAAVFAPLIATQDPLATGLPGDAPSHLHWFGTDRVGRDVFARVVYGARWSLMIGLGATLLALVLGGFLGALAATSRRAADEGVMRTLDVVMAFPAVALAAVLVTVFGKGLPVLIAAIAFLYTPSIARVVRGNVLSQYGEDYVNAEKVIGAGRIHILRRHVTVNVAAPILVYCTIMVAGAIVFEASLSFVGAGVQDPDPSWGSVIAYGKTLVLAGGWWATLFPGLFILLSVLALNVLAEGVSDAWAAPAGRENARAKGTAATGAAVVGATEIAGPDGIYGADGIDGTQDAQGQAIPLTGLAEAGRRLAESARPLPTGAPLLSVRGLTISFDGRHGGVDIVDHIDFDVRPGEVLGLVGESGCGKSLTSLAVMGLAPRGARIGGQIMFDGRDLLTVSAAERRKLLGHDMAMIYQDALSSLNPAMQIKAQLGQLIRRGGTRTAAELLELVGLDPGRTLRSYPHELSGGQRQRVLIAMALSRDPRLIVADEPTTALDVTVQAQVMELLLRLRTELGFALLLVSHDLALIAEVTDRVCVMYGGQIAEAGVTSSVVGGPRHHYARGLLGAVLSLEAADARLIQIRGTVPAPAEFPAGCRFSDRCPAADQVCWTTPAEPAGDPLEHAFACHHPATSDTKSRTQPGTKSGTGTQR